jgi:hypothetical protein
VKEKFMKGSVIAGVPSYEKKSSSKGSVIAEIPPCERKVHVRLRDSQNSII